MQSIHLESLFADVNPEWMRLFKKNPELRNTLKEALKVIKDTDANIICPPYSNVLDCFRYFAPQDTKLVIMGQDPYYGVGEATGLCFSIGNGRLTPSLRNISLAVERSCGQKIIDYRLTDWAQQGILMLNARLTTVLKKAKEDGHEIWEAFTNRIIEWLDTNVNGLTFVLWGNNAKAKSSFIKNSKIMTYTHPSPMADNYLPREQRFINCTHFIDINNHLINLGQNAIKWGDDIKIDEVSATTGNATGVTTGVTVVSDVIDSTTNGNKQKLSTCNNRHIVFVDGGCIGNGKKKARASYAFYISTGPLATYEEAAEIGNYNGVTATNNRGELLAFINALKYIDSKDNAHIKTITIISDSSYCIGIVSSWLDKWIAEGTLNERKNIDLLTEMDTIVKKIKEKGYIIETIHQNSHQPAPVNKESDEYFKWHGNDKADKLATGCLL